MTHRSGTFIRNTETASGSAKLVATGGSLRRSRVSRSIAGSAASDDRELIATACAGNAARTKSRKRTPPNSSAGMYNINVTTSFAGPYDDGIAHRQVIGNSTGSEVGHAGALGVSFVNGYNSGGPSYKTGFTFAKNFTDYPTAGVSGASIQ